MAKRKRKNSTQKSSGNFLLKHRFALISSYFIAIAFFLILFCVFYVKGNQSNKGSSLQHSSVYQIYKVVAPYPLISKEINSPDGMYKIEQSSQGDAVNISILDNKNQVIVQNLLLLNEKEIGYNTKIRCQCGTTFSGWYSNDTFVITVTNGGGEAYEYVVSARNGKVNEDSFRRIK